MDNTVYLVVPCYNEQAMLPVSAPVLFEKLEKLISSGLASPESRVLFVDDGSADETWSIIEKLHKENKHCSALRLSRNRGHQNAVWAGLEYAAEHAAASISIDADLQDDVNAIDEMLRLFSEGCDIVYGVRSGREKDSFLKRFTAEGYYRVIAALGGNIVFNHADFRLMSLRAMKALLEYPERNLFLRGMVPMLGFKTGEVSYERDARSAGESKYTIKKMLKLAVDGITALSVKPIRAMAFFGTVLFLLSIIAIIIMAVLRAGVACIAAASAWGAAGLVLSGLGLLGEYIGHIYDEVKARPRYFIMDKLE